jgi:hypothetical protein
MESIGAYSDRGKYYIISSKFSIVLFTYPHHSNYCNQSIFDQVALFGQSHVTSLPPVTIVAEFTLRNASKRYITCIFTIFGRFVIISQLGGSNRVQIWILLEISFPEIYNITWVSSHCKHGKYEEPSLK